MSEHKVKGIAFGAIYSDDFGAAYRFYSEILGLEKEYDMGSAACFFKLGDGTGLYVQGKNRKVTYDADTMRVGFVFAVESAAATWDRLAKAEVKFVQKEPMHMGGDNYWFQFYDPAGNLLEALGGK